MPKFLPLSLALLASTTLVAGTAALAQPTPEPRVMTRADAETHAAAAFARLDVNQDGNLTAADRADALRPHFDAADTDGNGQLSFAEAGAMNEMRREKRHEQRAERSEERRENRAEHRPRGMAMGRMGRQMGGQMLESADADGNGEISQAEFTSVALSRFDRADTDSDGTISRDERRGAFRARSMRQG